MIYNGFDCYELKNGYSNYLCLSISEGNQGKYNNNNKCNIIRRRQLK